MTMQRLHGLAAVFGSFAVLAGCGRHPGGDASPDAGNKPQLSGIERCAASGTPLREEWAVNNLHGPVVSLAAGGQTVAVGSQDQSVKQWDLEAGASPGAPTYGTPFSANAGSVVGALAFSGDGLLYGGDALGRLLSWRLSDAQLVATQAVETASTQQAIVSVAASAEYNAIAVADQAFGGNILVLDRTTGATTGPLKTALWGVSVLAFAPGGVFITGGEIYGSPTVERWAAMAPEAAVDSWTEQSEAGPVVAVAVDSGATTLVAAGPGLIATFSLQQLAAGPSARTAIPGHRAMAVALLPSGDYFVTAGQEGTLRLWKTADASLSSTLTIPAPVGLGLDASGDHAFTSGADGLVHAFSCSP